MVPRTFPPELVTLEAVHSVETSIYLLIIFNRTAGISISAKDTFPLSECVSRKGTNRNITSYGVTETSSGFETKIIPLILLPLFNSHLLTGCFFTTGDE